MAVLCETLLRHLRKKTETCLWLQNSVIFFYLLEEFASPTHEVKYPTQVNYCSLKLHRLPCLLIQCREVRLVLR